MAGCRYAGIGSEVYEISGFAVLAEGRRQKGKKVSGLEAEKVKAKGIQFEFADQRDHKTGRSGCSSVYSAWLRTMC